MARLALVVLAFGLIICVYAESDEVQEYRHTDYNRYSRYKERYDHNRDSGENHEKWEDRPSRRDYNNKGRYNYAKYKNWDNDPDYHHSGKENSKYDTDYHGNEHENSDWASRDDSDYNRGDSHRNKGRRGGWNNNRDFRGRHRDNYKRKSWNNRDNYGSGENKGHGYDYHYKNDRIYNNRPWYTGGHDDNKNDKQNNRGHKEKDSGERREFDTPSRGVDPCDNYERSRSKEPNYDTTRYSWNKPNTDSESTSNFRPTKNDHYNNGNSQSNRGRDNSYEGDRRFEDNGNTREGTIDNYERSTSEEPNYDTTRYSWNKPNTDSESTSNFEPTKNDQYNNGNSQSNRGRGNSYEDYRRFEDNGNTREGTIDNYERSTSEPNYDTSRYSWNKPNIDSESTSNFEPTKNYHYNNINSQSNRGKGNSYEGDRSFKDNGKAREDTISGQIPKHNSHIVGPYENNHRDSSGEHRYNEDETRENTNNNERKNRNYASKTVILNNNNGKISKNNQHAKVSANHLVDGPGETKNNNERIDNNDRSIIDSVSNRDDGLIKTVSDNDQDEKVSANDQIYRQQDNTQGEEDSSQSQNSRTNDNNDHEDQNSIKVE